MYIHQLKHYLYLDSTVSEQHKVIKQRELYRLCAQRVRAYKYIELGMISLQMDENSTYTNFLKVKVRQILDDHDLLMFNKNQFLEQKDDDQLTFHILQIVYAQSEEKIRQYVKYEKMILHARLLQILYIENDARWLMQALGIQCQEVEKDEWIQLQLRNNIEISCGQTYTNGESEEVRRKKYSKVPFQYVLSGLSKMKIFLQKGIAYIHQEQLLKAVVDAFGDNLTKKLTKLSNNPKYAKIIESDERLSYLVKKLPEVDMSDEQEFIQAAQSETGTFSISIMTIDHIAKKSFPLCMKYLYDKIMETRHLKHFGRLQLGLFLKGAGLKIDDSLHFWKVNQNNYDSQMEYNVKHNYGLIGNRVDYTPQSCQTIIGQHPGSNQEYHGCPFKHMNPASLKSYLMLQGVPENEIQNIQGLSKQHHYQISCKKTFEVLHHDAQSKIGDSNIVHPLSYYQASRKYYELTDKPIGGMQEEK